MVNGYGNGKDKENASLTTGVCRRLLDIHVSYMNETYICTNKYSRFDYKGVICSTEQCEPLRNKTKTMQRDKYLIFIIISYL